MRPCGPLVESRKLTTQSPVELQSQMARAPPEFHGRTRQLSVPPPPSIYFFLIQFSWPVLLVPSSTENHRPFRLPFGLTLNV